MVLLAKKYQGRRGQFLIEALIAISILTIGFLAVLALLNRSLALNRLAADNYTASYLAAEGIEVVKNLIDHNAICKSASPSPSDCQSQLWDYGITTNNYAVQYDDKNLTATRNFNDPLLFDPGKHIYNYISGDKTPFKREVIIENNNGYSIRVNSIVTWRTLGGSQFEINLEDRFYNWRG